MGVTIAKTREKDELQITTNAMKEEMIRDEIFNSQKLYHLERCGQVTKTLMYGVFLESDFYPYSTR